MLYASAEIYYLTDTLCGWCNIARVEINKLVTALPALGHELDTEIRFEMLHARLFVDDYVPEITEAMIKRAQQVGFKTGPKLTGQRFSSAYIELLQTSGYRHDSHLSSLAFAAVSRLSGIDAAYHFAEELQSRVYDFGEAASEEKTILFVAKAIMKKRLREAGTPAFSLDEFTTTLYAPETLALAEKTAERAQNWLEKADLNGAPSLVLVSGEEIAAVLDPFRAEKNLDTVRLALT